MIINSLTQMMPTMPLLAASQSSTSPPNIDIIPYPIYNGDNWDKFISTAEVNRELMNQPFTQELPAFQRDQIEEQHLRSALAALASSDTFRILTDEIEQRKMFSEVCDIIKDRYSSKFISKYQHNFYLGTGITTIASCYLAMESLKEYSFENLAVFIFGMALAWFPRMALGFWDKENNTNKNVALARNMGFYSWGAGLAGFIGMRLTLFLYHETLMVTTFGIMFLLPLIYKYVSEKNRRQTELNHIMREFKEGKLISSHFKRTKTP